MLPVIGSRPLRDRDREDGWMIEYLIYQRTRPEIGSGVVPFQCNVPQRGTSGISAFQCNVRFYHNKPPARTMRANYHCPLSSPKIKCALYVARCIIYLGPCFMVLQIKPTDRARILFHRNVPVTTCGHLMGYLFLVTGK